MDSRALSKRISKKFVPVDQEEVDKKKSFFKVKKNKLHVIVGGWSWVYLIVVLRFFRIFGIEYQPHSPQTAKCRDDNHFFFIDVPNNI